MIIKSRLKLQRKVLFEKIGQNKPTIADSFKWLTNDCKIMYNPKYKSRFFLTKDNQVLISILTHGNIRTITIEEHAIRLIVARHYKVRITNDNWTYAQSKHKHQVFWAVEKFIKQYGYFLRRRDNMTYRQKVEYNLYLKSLIYLNKGDNEILRSSDLWFTTN